jgi:flagellar biosynthesis protein FlhF
MTMKMKTFRAPSMREAMEQIKETFGPDAVILTSRVLRSGPNGLVELVAAMDKNPSSQTTILDVPSTGVPDPESFRLLRTELTNLRRELRQLRSQRVLDVQATQQWDLLVSELKSMSRAMGISSAVPQSKEALISRLVGGGVEMSLARTLVDRALQNTRDITECPQLIGQDISQALEPAPALWDRNKRTISALVGPTGVGKTTTLAKIAAQAAVKNHRKVAVIAADTYRISGVEQVGQYCDLIGVPWALATGSSDLVAAVNQFHDADLVLIDTAGQNPWKEDLLDEMDGLLAGVPVERHLCVSATTVGSDLSQIVRRYGDGGLRSLIITKVDEARTMGGLLSTVWGNDYQIAHITTGQEVPNDIEQPDAQWLCRAVLG